MSMITWVILGIIGGSIACALASEGNRALVTNLALGVVGAVIGGWLFSIFGLMGHGGFTLYSDALAIAGAAVLLSAHHVLLIDEPQSILEHHP